MNLSNNNIENLTDKIGKLKSLKILYLFSNKLSELPKSIIELNNLEVLSINSNKFKYLLYLPNNIRDLDISYNQFVEFPYFILYRHKIKYIDVRHNKLQYFHPQKLKLQTIKIFEGNNIPKEILIKLEKLNPSKSFNRHSKAQKSIFIRTEGCYWW